MTALKAVGWAACVLAFCVVLEFMRRVDGWMRRQGLAEFLTGNPAYVLVFTRVMQVLVLGLGIYGFVKIIGG